VPARVLPVDASATIVVVDLTGLAPPRIGPVLQTAVPDPAEHLVELVFADQECANAAASQPVVVGEVQ